MKYCEDERGGHRVTGNATYIENNLSRLEKKHG
jgi:hypothetical protein